MTESPVNAIAACKINWKLPYLYISVCTIYSSLYAFFQTRAVNTTHSERDFHPKRYEAVTSDKKGKNNKHPWVFILVSWCMKGCNMQGPNSNPEKEFCRVTGDEKVYQPIHRYDPRFFIDIGIWNVVALTNPWQYWLPSLIQRGTSMNMLIFSLTDKIIITAHNKKVKTCTMRNVLRHNLNLPLVEICALVGIRFVTVFATCTPWPHRSNYSCFINMQH